MKTQGNFNRVLLMTFSEFGRRVAQNASNGTDHGAPPRCSSWAAASSPASSASTRASTNLNPGDLAYNLDFRSVYATILDRGCAPPAKKFSAASSRLLNLV